MLEFLYQTKKLPIHCICAAKAYFAEIRATKNEPRKNKLCAKGGPVQWNKRFLYISMTVGWLLRCHILTNTENNKKHAQSEVRFGAVFCFCCGFQRETLIVGANACKYYIKTHTDNYKSKQKHTKTFQKSCKTGSEKMQKIAIRYRRSVDLRSPRSWF